MAVDVIGCGDVLKDANEGKVCFGFDMYSSVLYQYGSYSVAVGCVVFLVSVDDGPCDSYGCPGFNGFYFKFEDESDFEWDGEGTCCLCRIISGVSFPAPFLVDDGRCWGVISFVGS